MYIFDVHRAVHRNIISIVKPTRCTNVSNSFYFRMTFYMFRTVFPSITRGSRLYIREPGYAVARWLRCCATNRKVAGSIPAGVSGFFIDI